MILCIITSDSPKRSTRKSFSILSVSFLKEKKLTSVIKNIILNILEYTSLFSTKRMTVNFNLIPSLNKMSVYQSFMQLTECGSHFAENGQDEFSTLIGMICGWYNEILSRLQPEEFHHLSCILKGPACYHRLSSMEKAWSNLSPRSHLTDNETKISSLSVSH